MSVTNLSAELLPCPFCSGPPEMTGEAMTGYTVVCHSCGGEGGSDGSYTRAITHWNTRAMTPQPTADEVERVAFALLTERYGKKAAAYCRNNNTTAWRDEKRAALSAMQRDGMGEDVERLRAALIRSGRAVGCFLADNVSTDFLMHVPAEVEAKVAALNGFNAQSGKDSE